MHEPKLTLQQFAWANAAFDSGRSKGEVLPLLGLDETGWRAEQQLWLALIAQRVDHSRLDLAQRYASDYAKYRFESSAPGTSNGEQQRRAAIALAAPALPLLQAPQPVVAPQPGPASPAPPPPRALEPVLSLYEFAMLRAELDLVPQAADRTWGKYGLAEGAARQNELEAWQQRLRDDAALRSEYQRLHKDADRHWRSLMRR